MTEAEQIMKRCQVGTRNYNEANNLHADCYRVIGKLLKTIAELESQKPVAYCEIHHLPEPCVQCEKEHEGYNTHPPQRTDQEHEALQRIAEKLRRAGANLPAPQIQGTIESCIVTGLSIALANVETEIETLAKPLQRTEQNFCPRCGKRTNDIHTCTPPQRTWVGLTDEESNLLLNQSDLLDMFENIGWYSAPKNAFKKNSAIFIRAIETKLKEKNT
jgi:hypothetical protein